MDIPRKISRWPQRLRLGGIAIAGAAALAAGWVYLSASFSSSAVDASELVIGQVQRSSLVRDVRAPGVLVPTELRWLTAQVDGRVETIFAEAGAYVMPDTVILELSNPTVARDADTARIELEVLEAQTSVFEKRMINEVLAQQAVIAEFHSQFENARFRKEANESLGDVVSRVDLNESVLLAGQYEERLRIERERLVRLQELQVAELQANKAELMRAKRQLQLQEELLDGLTVRAGIEGILQEVPVESGQSLLPGALLARVAREDNFKTELSVQEGQAREIVAGQTVVISAGGQHASGKVSRIDPAVQDGTVLVDVTFTDKMLPGARPDLRVQGVIEIDYVENTLVIPRPVFSQENSTANLFVVGADGSIAHKTAVQLGIGSVDRIEVLGGLQEGDRVIVSDMTRFSEQDFIELTQ
jgi:HlyD family secretion protein